MDSIGATSRLVTITRCQERERERERKKKCKKKIKRKNFRPETHVAIRSRTLVPRDLVSQSDLNHIASRKHLRSGHCRCSGHYHFLSVGVIKQFAPNRTNWYEFVLDSVHIALYIQTKKRVYVTSLNV
ncbi:hypothetical protein PUN28_019276 [Cardiocondyla obscurior]|uniref:Uncharacterized protein n=1 Tax=Cardiocondyla obscurior TaxID=286306 RepID=A0AAW2EAR5_9HYME